MKGAPLLVLLVLTACASAGGLREGATTSDVTGPLVDRAVAENKKAETANPDTRRALENSSFLLRQLQTKNALLEKAALADGVLIQKLKDEIATLNQQAGKFLGLQSLGIFALVFLGLVVLGGGVFVVWKMMVKAKTGGLL